MADVYLRAADTAQSKAGPDEALSILSKGLRQFPLHRVLLNRKASLHIQAKQYGEALKAAEQLVKVKPSESPGYVHALTVFQTLGKTKSVIKICQAAINQISAKDPAYEVFVKELENRQEESSSRNESASRHQKRKVSKLESHAVPLQWDLPFELLTSVFSYLTFPALMKCAATCQTWRATIHKNKRFWSTLDLTSAPKVTSEAIQILLKRSGRSLRCLNLASCKHTGNGTLKGLVTSGCVALEDLDLSNTSKITFKTFPDYLKAFGRSLVQLNLSNTLADDVAIRRTLDVCRLLRVLKLNNCVSLTDSCLQICDNFHTRQIPLQLVEVALSGTMITDRSLLSLCRASPNLRRLDLSRCKQITSRSLINLTCLGKLEALSLTHTSMSSPADLSFPDVALTLAEKCQSIRQFSLASCVEMNDLVIGYLSSFWDHLHTIDVSTSSQMTDTGLTSLADNCSNLIVVNISSCARITDDGVTALVSRAMKLSDLDISGIYNLTDKSVQAIAQHCRNLHSLDVSNCSRLTGLGFQQLPQRHVGKTLRSLQVNNCQKVSIATISTLRINLPNLRISAQFS